LVRVFVGILSDALVGILERRAAIRAAIRIDPLHGVAQFPTYSEAYLTAAELLHP
jgi:hypothetical protein